MGRGNGDGNGGESGRGYLDDVLRAAFRDESECGESALESIERATGAVSRVLLRDPPEEATPVVRVLSSGGPDALQGDRRYQLMGEIARGGVGVVFKGRDRDLGRTVALKVLRVEHRDNPQVTTRFIEEAQIGGQLQHPGIVPVYGVGLDADGRPFFAMKLVKGQTLSARLEDRADPVEDRRRFLGVFEQVAQTMAYAHARGVIHRDLKPSNVMIGAFGEVQVVDWGLAKVLGTEDRKPSERPQVTIVQTVRSGPGSSGSESLTGSVMGTPAYMPPEQALGKVEDLDERADVFSLGAILTEILTGKPPYTGEDSDRLIQAMHAKLDDAFARLDACDADPELVALAKRCLAPVRGERPRDAGVVARTVTQHLEEVEARARREELAVAEARAEAAEERQRLARARHRAAWERRARKRVLLTAVAGILAIVLGGGLYLMKDARDRSRELAAEATVSERLREATEAATDGRWHEALEAAKRAAASARTGGASEEARREAERMLASLSVEAEETARAERAAAEEAALVARLDGIRLDLAVDGDFARADAAFAAAFREAGVDLDEVAPAEAAARLAGRSRKVELAAALDWWAYFRRRRLGSDRAKWTRIIEVARRADPDPWRNRLRDAFLSEDAGEVRALAEEVDVKTLPTWSLCILAALLGEQDPAAAGELLRDAWYEHPDDFSLCLQRGHFLLREEGEDRWERASGFLLAGVALAPESGGAWAEYGISLLGAGEEEGALLALRRAEELRIDFATVQNNLGIVLGKLGRTEDAMRAFDRALEIETRPHLRFNYVWNEALMFWRSGEFDQAIAALERERRVQPDHIELLNTLAWYRISRADPTEEDVAAALRDAERGHELAPEARALTGTLAAAHYRAGNAEGAVRLFETLLPFPAEGNVGALDSLYYAMALKTVGRGEEAEQVLRAACERLDAAPDWWEDVDRLRAEATAVVTGEGR